MSSTAQKLYEHFKTDKQYKYSPDSSIRDLEMKAVEELESNGHIVVKMKTIGYVIAEIA